MCVRLGNCKCIQNSSVLTSCKMTTLKTRKGMLPYKNVDYHSCSSVMSHVKGKCTDGFKLVN